MRMDNSWVKLSKIVPWYAFASLYVAKMDIKQDRLCIYPIIGLGKLVINYQRKSLDSGAIIAILGKYIQMQFFLVW